ncbi:helix-turn-helix domain-containing protein [Kitasatospora sp. NPDC001132]
MSGEPTIGENLARLRNQAGLTQEELHTKSGVSVATIRALEQNQRTTALMGTISKLATALDVNRSSLLGQRETLHQDDGRRDESVSALRRVIHPIAFLPVTIVEAPPLSELDRSITDAWETYHRGEFADLVADLPVLLEGVRAAVRDAGGADRRKARAALSLAYQVAAQAAGHLGQDDLARSAIEYAMAEADLAEDRVLIAGARNALSWVLLRQNEGKLAGLVATAAADELNPRFTRDNYAAVRMWGRLRLSAATSASRQDDYQAAKEMLADAKRCTTVVDVDAMDYLHGGHHAAFGPSKVAMVMTEVAMSQHKPADALKAARSVSPTPRIPPMTRGRHLLDVAHAQTWQEQYGDAVATMNRVYGMAPEWLRYQVLGREVIRQVQENKGRRQLAGLAQLARHVGLAGRNR